MRIEHIAMYVNDLETGLKAIRLRLRNDIVLIYQQFYKASNPFSPPTSFS